MVNASHMKQVILIEPGKTELRDVPVPEPSAGEVVIKIETALTCGTDLKAYVRGHTLIPMPGPFGHEYAGTIAKAGAGVRDFKEGDPVMGVHSAPCLECRYCVKGLPHLCDMIMEQKALGSFAEYMLLPAQVVRQNLFHKPENISFEEAALLEPLSCVVHPYSKLQLNNIDTALVIGAGPIGLMHLAYLNMKGKKVIVADIAEDRLSIAKHMGAEHRASPDTLQEITKGVTDSLGVDLVIECTGQQKVWEKSVSYARRGGTIVLFGGCPSGTEVTYDAHRLHYDELTLLSSFHFTPENVKSAYQLLAERNMDVSPLISGSFPLSHIKKAFSLLQEGKGIKYAIKP
jgi:L-iditol 2-dehydrogenase